MKHTLVKPDGTIGSSRDFTGAPPTLSPNKGRWLPDNPPVYDSMVSMLQIVTPIPANAAAIPYAVVPRQEPELVANLTAVMQAYLDDTARTRNYDGILSLCSYAASAHPTFGPEGRAGVTFRDDTWAKGYAILAAVKAGQRAVPTKAELLAELPTIAWPV